MSTAIRKTLSLVVVAAMFAAIVAVPATAMAATGTKLTIGASGKSASIYAKVKLTGTLKTSSGKAVKRVKLRLEKQASGETSWTVIAKPQTNSKGRALVNVRPAKDAKYRFVFLGNATYGPAQSKGISVSGYQPNTQSFEGTESATFTSVKLQKGLAVVSASVEPTTAPFVVRLLDKNGKLVTEFFNEASPFSGETAYKVAKTGTYKLEVSAGADWAVKIVQPRKLKAKGFVTMSGTGDQVSDVFSLTRKNKSYWFKWTNASGAPIKIVIRNQAGTIVKTIADSSKTSGTTKQLKLSKGLYVIEVDAAGPWTVAFKK